MRIGFAAIPYDKKLLPVTSKKSARQTMERLIHNILRLDEPVFKMLRLENEEHAGKPGTVDELWHIHRETGIPLLFDVAHYRVNPLERGLQAREIVTGFLDTWKGASTFPVLHYSTIQGRDGPSKAINGHERFYTHAAESYRGWAMKRKLLIMLLSIAAVLGLLFLAASSGTGEGTKPAKRITAIPSISINPYQIPLPIMELGVKIFIPMPFKVP